MVDAATDPPPLRDSPRLRRPLCAVAVMFALGCLAGIYLALPLWIWFTAGLVAGAVCLAFPDRPWSDGSLWLAILFSGAAWSGLKARPVHDQWIGHQVTRPAESIETIGRVASDPWTYHWDPGGRFTVSAVLSLEQKTAGQGMAPVSGRVRLRLSGTGEAPNLQYGDRVHLAGVILTDPKARLPGNRYVVKADAGDVSVLETGAGSFLLALSYRARAVLAERLSLGIEDEAGAVSLVQALMLGYRQGIPAETREAFARTGSLHILAISGMHVGILAGLFLLVLRSAGVSRIHWVWYLIPFLGFYTLATGASVSAARASLMAVCYWLGPALRRKPDPMSALGLAALVLLVVDPHDIVNPGFQLSFAVVTGLLVLTPPLLGWLQPLAQRDPWAAGDEAGWLTQSRGMLTKLLALLSVSVAAWLASFPLIAWHFHLVSPIALPANLVIVPLTFLILTAGAVSVSLGWILPGLSFLMNHAVVGLSCLLLGTIELLEKVPWGHWFVPSPRLGWVLAWYPVVALVLWGGRQWRRVGLVSCLFLAVVMAGTPWFAQPTSVTGKALGEASVYLLRSGRSTVLIDTGPEYQSRTLIDWLRELGINRLDGLVLATPSLRHAGGLTDLAQAMPIGEVLAAPPALHTRGFESLLDVTMDRKGRPLTIRRLAEGDRGSGYGSLHWEVLHPPGSEDLKTMRDSALVIRWMEDASSWVHYPYLTPALMATIADQPRLATSRVILGGVLEDPEHWPERWWMAVGPERLILSAEALQSLGTADRNGLIGELKRRGVEVEQIAD